MKTTIPSSLSFSGTLSAPAFTTHPSVTAKTLNSSSALKPKSLFGTPLIHGKPYALATKIVAAYFALNPNASQFKVEELNVNEQEVPPTTTKSLLVAGPQQPSSNYVKSEMTSNGAKVAWNPSALSIRLKPNTFSSSPIEPQIFSSPSKNMSDGLIKNTLNSVMTSPNACQLQDGDFSSSSEITFEDSKLSLTFKAIKLAMELAMNKHALKTAKTFVPYPATKSSTTTKNNMTTKTTLSIVNLWAINRLISNNRNSEMATSIASHTTGSKPNSLIACPVQVDVFSSSNEIMSEFEHDLAPVKAFATNAALPTTTAIATEVLVVKKQGKQSGLCGSSFVREKDIDLNFTGTKSWKSKHKTFLLSLLPLHKPILTVISLLILSSVTTANNVNQYNYIKHSGLLDQSVLDNNDNLMQDSQGRDVLKANVKGSINVFDAGEDTQTKAESDLGRSHFDLLGDNNLDVQESTKTHHTSTRHYIAHEDMMHQLKSISRRLRGGAEHIDLIDDVQNIVQAQLENVESMKKMYKNGDGKGLAHAVKAVIGDGNPLVEATDHSFKNSQLAVDTGDLIIDDINDLKDNPDSHITMFVQTEFFKPQLFEDIVVQMQDVVTVLEDVKSVLHPSSASQRRLKSNLFSSGKTDGEKPFQFDQDPFEFGANSNSHFGARPWDFTDVNMQKVLRQKRGTVHLPDISKFIHRGNDANSANRLLKVNERHKRRLESIDVCQPNCDSKDATCNCNRLVGCINSMSDYDIALLFVGKYIDYQTANFTSKLSLFDTDFNIIRRIESIRNLASTKDCIRLLPELHSACNPSKESCSGPNSHSFQLSVDDVCDAINTPTKLLLGLISDELDGYWGENGRESLTTTCQGRLAFSACQDFTKEFDNLYQGRDTAKYPHWNPIREDPTMPVDRSNFLQFPTKYKFERSVHGVDELATTMNDKVRVVSNMTLCMHAPGGTNTVVMAACKAQDRNQDFYYVPASREIRLRRSEQCVAYHLTSHNLYMAGCSDQNNRKWHYNIITQEVKTFWNGRCLDLAGSGKLYLNDNCHGGSNQKFMMPSQWLPDITSLNRVWVYSDESKCMGVDSSGNIKMLPCVHSAMNTTTCGTFHTKQSNYRGTINVTSTGIKCQRWDSQTPHTHQWSANDENYCRNPDNDERAWCYTTNSSIRWEYCNVPYCESSQNFEYDALTRQIKESGKCMDYNYNQNSMSMTTCHNGKNQQFYFDVSTNRFRNGWDNRCLDWDGDKLYMTDCDARSSEKYKIPTQWFEAISTSSFDEVRVFSDLNLCLELFPQENDFNVLQVCNPEVANQKIFYNGETLEIKLWGTDFCVDYHSSSSDVYMHKCHEGYNQKWYHERSTNQLRSLRSFMCMEWSNGKLSMQTCHGGNNQKFLIPSLWMGVRSKGVRGFKDITKCMVYNPDQSNNVYMSSCEKGGVLGQTFEYNPLTYEIKQDGLCLDIIVDKDEWIIQLSNSLAYFGFEISVGNTLMWPCNGRISQKWSVDIIKNQVKSQTTNGPCLKTEVDGNIIGATCLPETNEFIWNQKFLFPESWTMNEQAVSKTIYPYYSIHVPPAIWSSKVCHVDWLKNVIKSCDDSMKLLLGSTTSLGTLKSISKVVNMKGPKYMPGTCCLDSPLTSQFFGYYFDPSTMECQNRGPWHLGISIEACESAGGRWFRSPCFTLKDCIDQRPLNGTDHFSPSFEDFAKNLEIEDANDEARCMKVRAALGFNSDHPFDTEVCQKFVSYTCDKFFTEVDDMVKDKGKGFTGMEYKPVQYPNDPDLTFEELPERTGSYQAFQVPKLGAAGHLDDMQRSVIALKHTLMATNEVWELLIANNPCDVVPEIFGLKAACNFIRKLHLMLAYAIRSSILLAFDIVSSQFELGTDSPSRVVDVNLRIEAMFTNFQVFDSWNTVALGTINKNVVDQHSQMRENLQKRHTLMEKSIKDEIVDLSNLLSDHYAKLNKTVTQIASDLAPRKLTDFNSISSEHDFVTNEPDVTDLVLTEVLSEGHATKISCGFDVSLARGLAMNVVNGEITSLFVKEDTSQSAVAIPLVVLVENNCTVEVTVRSNSAIAGGKKTVAIFYQSSSGQLVPYVRPATCLHLDSDICDQSGDDFILYEFSFVTIDQTRSRKDSPVVCNVIVHPSTMNVPTQRISNAVNSTVRYDLLPTASFPLSCGNGCRSY